MKSFLKVYYINCYKYFIVFILLLIATVNLATADKSVRIGFEGMPGTGKTSLLARLVQHLPNNCIFLPEVNLQNNSEYNKNKFVDVYDELWKQRLEAILSGGVDRCFIMDRTYFSNLAYTYAIGSNEEYVIKANQIKRDFSSLNFDLIIVLVASPETGLQRRQENNDNPPHPWDKIDFLYRLKKFYVEEFLKIYKGKYLYIYTDNMTIDDLEKKITTILSSYIKLNFLNTTSTIEGKDLIKNKMLTFARDNHLGRPYTDVVNVLGYPTIYYRQHAIQNNENNEIVYFDTFRLRQILIKGL